MDFESFFETEEIGYTEEKSQQQIEDLYQLFKKRLIKEFEIKEISNKQINKKKLSVGDIVMPKQTSGIVLTSGCYEYRCGVVVCIEPFILVSQLADMRWESLPSSDNFEKIGALIDITEHLKRLKD